MIYIFINLIDLTHHTSYIIKFAYEKSIIKKALIKNNFKFYQYKTEEGVKEFDIYKLIWFYNFDMFIIIFICINILTKYSLFVWLVRRVFQKHRCFEFCGYEIIVLNKFKGINIIRYEINFLNIIKNCLPKKFSNLNEKEKNEIIFEKERVKKYQYHLNENQINLIQKINDIRENNHIPLLKYYQYEYLSEFIINEAELIFNEKEKIFKLSDNFYIFKYPKNEIQNLLDDGKILNIIKIETLNTIKIIEQIPQSSSRKKKEIWWLISIYDDNKRNKKKNNNTKVKSNEISEITFLKGE